MDVGRARGRARTGKETTSVFNYDSRGPGLYITQTSNATTTPPTGPRSTSVLTRDVYNSSFVLS